jgi:hypothetical protein
MANYTKVSIDIMENGYTATVINKNGKKGKQFIFANAKKMRSWLKDNLAPTGEVQRFSDALDDDNDKSKEDFVHLNPNSFLNMGNQATGSYTSTTATS